MLALVAVVPAGLLLRRFPRFLPVAYFAIGIAPFFNMEALSLSFFYDYDLTIDFRGETRGLEITILDLVAWITLVALGRGRYPSPFAKARWFYVLMLFASVLWATLPIYALFSIAKVLRAYVVLRVVSRAMEDPRSGPHFVRGLAWGALWAFSIAVRQRFAEGLPRVFGPFPHPNTFAMAINVVFAVAFAIVLSGRGKLFAAVVTGGAVVSVILTLSRASLILTVGAAVLLVAVSMRRGVTKRKLLIIGGGMAAGAVVFAVTARAIVDRFLNAPAISAEARELFNRAARMMLEDRPLGIGLNNFSYVLKNGGYATKVGLPEVDADGIAHNIYWLTLAELGVQGLIAYVVMILGPVVLAFRTAWRRGQAVGADVALGLGVGLVTLHLQGFSEWAIRQSTLTYLQWIAAGLVAGLARDAGVLRDRRG
ncbi:MAG: O-antigen ligase family protein [Polyangiales bacterium]